MATQLQQDAVVINMGDLNINPAEAQSPSSSKKKQDTLFGPNIGIVARGPEWTETKEKAIDELTPDVVRGWIAKSKEVRICVDVIAIPVCPSLHARRPPRRRCPLDSMADGGRLRREVTTRPARCQMFLTLRGYCWYAMATIVRI